MIDRLRPLLLLAMLFAGPVFAGRDVMLVLDNSGSMRRNDPARLAVPVVAEFIKGQPRDTRVGIILFAQNAELVLPLMPAEVAADGDSQRALARFNYSGRWTQTAAAIERALYELRSEGRPDAARAIVLMTDGLVDTGDKSKDAELERWLRQDLAALAKREGVRIFGIAFTEQADFQLLQSLAAGTGAEYFRVLTPEAIARAFTRIDAVLLAEREAPAAAAPAPAAEAKPTAPAEAAPVAPAAARDLTWLWALVVLVGLAAIGAAAWRWRGALFRGAVRDGGPFGVLYDSEERHELGGKPVIIGRAGGNDPSRYYVVVPEKTVGRWHATIERRGQTFWLRDEGSVNGTFVNDERVIGERPLKHRDTLRIHTHQFEFEIPELADADRTVMQSSPRLNRSAG
jgi:hypothetical protein